MNPVPPAPSPLSRWLLQALSGRDEASAAIGDVQEELARRVDAGRPPRWPLVWVEGQVVGYAFASLWTNAPRSGRSLRFIVRDGWRALRSAPGPTAFILLILTLGIAASTVTFSVVDAVVLRELPFDRSEGLVVVSGRTARGPSPIVAPQEYLAWRDATDAFASLAAVIGGGTSDLRFAGDVDKVGHATVTASLFEVLGVRPLIGSTFTRENELAGNDRVTVIGYELWQRRFGGTPDVVGRTLELPAPEGPSRILGVMPEGFSYPIGANPVEVWTPYAMAEDERTLNSKGMSRYVHVVGRLRDGVSPDQAVARLTATMSAVRAAQPKAYTDWRPDVTTLYDWLVGDVRGWMLLVLSTVGLVMLVACLNVANLLLTRSSGRARELAIRASLGATRKQIAGSLLIESLLLSLCAAGLGIVLATWGIGMAKAALPAGIARASNIALDLRVLGVTIVGAMATGLVFGAVPAWQASRTDLVALIKDSGTTMTAGRKAWRTSLLTLEVAFVSVLLVATTLFVSSFVRVTRTDLGFDRANLLFVPFQTFRDSFADVSAPLRQVPGVASVAAIAGGAPPLIMAAGLMGGSATTSLQLADAPAGADPLFLEMRRVTPEYFTAAGIPFVRGRVFDSPGPSRATTVVIDDVAARRLFGSRDPVGASVRGVGPLDHYTVVGVVANVRLAGPEKDAGPAAYFPLDASSSARQLLIRTTLPAASVVPAVQTALARFLPSDHAPALVYVLDDAFRRITAGRRFNAGLMLVFGVLAIFIGGAGIYAVMASVVAQQTREFGVRVALGASAPQIRETVMRQAGRYLLAGLAIGLPVAWSISRIFASLLFGVHPTDPFVYIVVAGVVLAVGLSAAMVPARRAARVDPIVTLRS